MSDGRFERVPEEEGGWGSCLAARHEVNPALSREEALDEERFLRALSARLGEPDTHSGDARFSFLLHDLETGLEFAAYVAKNGPSYGGDPELFDETLEGTFALAPRAREVLAAFDAWIEAALR